MTASAQCKSLETSSIQLPPRDSKSFIETWTNQHGENEKMLDGMGIAIFCYNFFPLNGAKRRGSWVCLNFSSSLVWWGKNCNEKNTIQHTSHCSSASRTNFPLRYREMLTTWGRLGVRDTASLWPETGQLNLQHKCCFILRTFLCTKMIHNDKWHSWSCLEHVSKINLSVLVSVFKYVVKVGSIQICLKVNFYPKKKQGHSK